MPSPLSVDPRVVATVAKGASFHRAAARFGGSVSSVGRWSTRFAQGGHGKTTVIVNLCAAEDTAPLVSSMAPTAPASAAPSPITSSRCYNPAPPSSSTSRSPTKSSVCARSLPASHWTSAATASPLPDTKTTWPSLHRREQLSCRRSRSYRDRNRGMTGLERRDSHGLRSIFLEFSLLPASAGAFEGLR